MKDSNVEEDDKATRVPETCTLLVEKPGTTSEPESEKLGKAKIADNDLRIISTATLSCSTIDIVESVTLEYTTQVNENMTSLCSRTLPCCSSRDSTVDDEKPKAKLLDLSLLKNPSFLMFCFSICLFTVAFKSAFTFLPALAKSRGCTEREAALLMSVAGVVDTIARILSGFCLDLPRIRKFRPIVYNIDVFTISILSFVMPSVHSFLAFAFLCGLFGAFTGAYISQKSVIIMDILGVDKLSSSLGLMIFFQGIGTLIGPPLSGKFLFSFQICSTYTQKIESLYSVIFTLLCDMALKVDYVHERKEKNYV